MSIELNSAYMSEETFRINQVPYVSNQETRKQEEDFRLRKNVISNSFHNFLVKKSKLFPLSDYPNRAHFFLRERTQELCRGEFVRPAYLGDFQLVDLIIIELKDHMTCFKFESSCWWKIYL